MKRRNLLLGLLSAPLAAMAAGSPLASNGLSVLKADGSKVAFDIDKLFAINLCPEVVSTPCTWARGESPVLHYLDEFAYYPVVPQSDQFSFAGIKETQ